MTARPLQAEDLAALLYFEAELERQERGIPWLAGKIGMPYGTLYTYFKKKQRALTMGDTLAILKALKISPDRGISEIAALALTLDEPDHE